MDAVFEHVNSNKYIYSLLVSVGAAAILYWLSKYFATKKDLQSHIDQFVLHRKDFLDHRNDHFILRDTVLMIDNNVKHLPSAAESNLIREEMAQLRGRLEASDTLFKQILQNQNILIENELRGDKK